MTVYACSCSILLKLVINNRITDTNKFLRICRPFKCLLVKFVLLARYRFVFLLPEESLVANETFIYDVFATKIGRVLFKTRP